MFLPPIFDAIVLVFALWAFVRHALEAKTSDGGWSINVLIRTLVADHLPYFVCFQIWMTLTLAANYTTDEVNIKCSPISLSTRSQSDLLLMTHISWHIVRSFHRGDRYFHRIGGCCWASHGHQPPCN
ncbi:hypothetical protein BJ138DRAFT_429004 [Hygrophoropsis aurantiaca]|uniref:Uncharacterized protein n=1 Tax=Hygrophoropsis aurantiaca TaxID=72124 RepID=A0ACB8A3U9_9AGAM|nr:hypothetical protein BJ138DRAFT_429004 [Hygrophoropsis aurantiaca]